MKRFAKIAFAGVSPMLAVGKSLARPDRLGIGETAEHEHVHVLEHGEKAEHEHDERVAEERVAMWRALLVAWLGAARGPMFSMRGNERGAS